MSSPLRNDDTGTVTWEHEAGDMYVATGVGTNGQRLPAVRSRSWRHISGINQYRGNKWLERDGKRYKIQSVYN